jgi:hypothetical protein
VSSIAAVEIEEDRPAITGRPGIAKLFALRDTDMKL